ncbi:MAG TPA: MerR family transcriptional regulator [Burkholderiales bacterium]
MPVPYAISEAARHAGITVRQVRTYLNAGPVHPCASTPGGYFLFDEACVTCLHPSARRSAPGCISVRSKIWSARWAAIQQLEYLVSGACAKSAMEVS